MHRAINVCRFLALALAAASSALAQMPIERELQLLQAPYAPHVYFAFNVELHVTTAVVGNGGSDNSVSIYIWDGYTWVHEATLPTPDPSGGAVQNYASGLALSDELLVVGAPSFNFHPTTQGVGEGAAFIYRRVDGAWAYEQMLSAPDGQAYDQFGGSVAIGSPGLVAVGAWGAGDDGAVYVFGQVNGEWAQEARLEVDLPVSSAGFGKDVVFHDGSLLVGGALGVREFLPTQDGWLPGQELYFPPQGSPTLLYGDRLALEGDALFAASPAFPEEEPGKVFVFEHAGGQWTPVQTIEDPELADGFACDVAATGDQLLVGAFRDLVDGFLDAGSVVVFDKASSGYVPSRRLHGSTLHALGHGGVAVAASAGRAIAAAPDHWQLGYGGFAEMFDIAHDSVTMLGYGLGGAANAPALQLLVPEPARGQPAELRVGGATALAAVVFVVGLSEADTSFKGGVLVPLPEVLVPGFQTDLSGRLTLGFPWPAELPAGVSVVLQAWIADATAPAHWAACNGLRVDVP